MADCGIGAGHALNDAALDIDFVIFFIATGNDGRTIGAIAGFYLEDTTGFNGETAFFIPNDRAARDSGDVRAVDSDVGASIHEDKFFRAAVGDRIVVALKAGAQSQCCIACEYSFRTCSGVQHEVNVSERSSRSYIESGGAGVRGIIENDRLATKIQRTAQSDLAGDFDCVVVGLDSRLQRLGISAIDDSHAVFDRVRAGEELHVEGEVVASLQCREDIFKIGAGVLVDFSKILKVESRIVHVARYLDAVIFNFVYVIIIHGVNLGIDVTHFKNYSFRKSLRKVSATNICHHSFLSKLPKDPLP